MFAIDVLHRVSLFADLHDEELQALAACLGERTFARDMVLFHKGSPSQALYLIESGKVRAFALSDGGQEITLEVYGPGECFGETALLDGQMRSAGATTLEPTVTYILERDEFLFCRTYQLCSSIMGVLCGPASRPTTSAWPELSQEQAVRARLSS